MNLFLVAIVRCKTGRTIEKYLSMFIVTRIVMDIPVNIYAAIAKAMR